MSERRTLGQILRGFGRIDEEDQQAALAYQRQHGGYFGEALVALGRLTSEEVDFSLAAQFDLPYIYPDPDSVDREAAQLVSPEWALAHRAIPIARTEHTLTVVVDSPVKAGAVMELEHRTGLEVQLAIASAAKIRELIREVYERGAPPEDSPSARPALGVDEFLDLAVAESASRFGISVRARRAMGWWDERGTVHRRHLTTGWEERLEHRLSPGPGERTGGATHPAWEARLSYRGTEIGVEVRSLEADGGRELLIRPVRGEDPLDDRFLPPPSDVVAEVRLLARSGTARFAVETEPAGLLERILPVVPALLLGPSYRSVHLVAGDGPPVPEEPASSSMVLRVPAEPEEREAFLRELRAFRLDGITASLPGDPATWLPAVMGAAEVVFVPFPDPDHLGSLIQAGISWELRIREEDEEGRLDWKFIPLRS
jgi:hypothetical protein